MRPCLAVVLCLSAVAAADLREQVQRLRPADLGPSEAAVLDNVARRAETTLRSIPRALNRDQADAARPGLRRNLERSLGDRRLPWRPDLKARVTGELRREGYRIEKIVYQSLPGSLVPAHLYLPERIEGRLTAVLFYNGHWFPDSKARPDFQAFCINMARLGFVVLNYDPFGQGERGLSARDHRRTEGLLAGVSQQGYAVYESRCALEYLLSRKEVDPDRVGMTGASGGGFNTWMMAALDDRIKVAVPVVGTADFYEQMVARRPRDWDPSDHCHYIPGLFRYANNHEFVTMVAPRPLLIVSALEDSSFPIAGVRAICEYGRSLYQSYGLGDRISYFEDSTAGHGYQRKKREAAYGWFLRWLLNRGGGRPHPEPEIATLPADAPELECFPDGRHAAGPAMVQAAVTLARSFHPRMPARLSDVLGPWPSPKDPALAISPDLVQRVVIPSEPDLNVPAVLLRAKAKPRGLLLAVDDRGKESAATDPVVQELLEGGWNICALDPRGIGELSTSKPNWVFAASLLLGQNPVWLQAWDMTRAAQLLMARSALGRQPVAIHARGDNASLAATYVVAHQRESKDLDLRWFVLRDAFISFRDFLTRPQSMKLSFTLQTDDRERRTPLDREVPPSYFVFDALEWFDIQALLESSRVRGLVVNPIDGDWKPMDLSAASKSSTRLVRVVSDAAPPEAVRRFLRTVRQ